MRKDELPYEEQTTPNLVREYRTLHVHSALDYFGEYRTAENLHACLSKVVTELRRRGVLD